MKVCKRGFTLLELMIAAAIIGVLAMFATQAFRRSAADVRVQDAKTRADVLGAALTRFLIDYPGYKDDFLAMPLFDVPAEAGACNPASITGSQEGSSFALPTLANCGYLERRSYLNGNFNWTISTDAKICVSAVLCGKVDSYWKKKYCTDGSIGSESENDAVCSAD